MIKNLNQMKQNKEQKCICKSELCIEHVYAHLAWCPKSYFYQEAVEEYKKSSWFGKIFKRDPRKYYNFLI